MHAHMNYPGSIRYSGTDIGLTFTNDFQLSDTDRRSYEKVFSSILVPYTALTIGEEIGQGACVGVSVRAQQLKQQNFVVQLKCNWGNKILILLTLI